MFGIIRDVGSWLSRVLGLDRRVARTVCGVIRCGLRSAGVVVGMVPSRTVFTFIVMATLRVK